MLVRSHGTSASTKVCLNVRAEERLESIWVEQGMEMV